MFQIVHFRVLVRQCWLDLINIEFNSTDFDFYRSQSIEREHLKALTNIHEGLNNVLQSK
jgi:hypothetical protein